MKLSDSTFLGILIFLAAFFAPWTASWARLPLQMKVTEGVALGFLYFWTFYLLTRKKIYFPPGSFPMLGVIGISLLSLAVSPAPTHSEFQWAQGLYQPGVYNFTVVARQVFYFLIYVGVVNLCRRKRLLIFFILKGYIVGGVIAALVGLAQETFFLLGRSAVGVYSTPRDPVPRILGTFNEPGPYSAFLATVIVVLMAAVLFKVGLFKKMALHGFLVIITLALILTFGSRGLVEAGVGMVYLFLAASKNNFRSTTRPLFALGMVIITLAVVYPQAFMGLKWAFGKIEDELFLNPSESYTGGRKAGLYIAPRMFLHSPLLGIGIGNYPFLRNDFADGIPKVSHLDLPGNVFLEFLAETGILGLLTFLCFIIGVALYVLRSYRFIHRYSDSGLMHGLAAACLGILVDFMVSSSLYFIHVWILPSLLVALAQANREAFKPGFQGNMQ